VGRGTFSAKAAGRWSAGKNALGQNTLFRDGSGIHHSIANRQGRWRRFPVLVVFFVRRRALDLDHRTTGGAHGDGADQSGVGDSKRSPAGDALNGE
jgi:hypothetical protein